MQNEINWYKINQHHSHNIHIYISEYRIISTLRPPHITQLQVPRGGDHLHTWRTTSDMFNKQSMSADRKWSSRLRVGHRDNNHRPLNGNLLQTCQKRLQIQLIQFFGMTQTMEQIMCTVANHLQIFNSCCTATIMLV